MYKSIEQLEKLRGNMLRKLDEIYVTDAEPQINDEIYKRQAILGNMAIGIYSDVAELLIPVLRDDGVDNTIWSKISLRLDKLSFISLPSADELMEKYKKSINSPVVVDVNKKTLTANKTLKGQKLSLPAFLSAIAAQGIVVPILLNIAGVTKFAWVKAVLGINATFIIAEVVRYFDLLPKKRKSAPSISSDKLADMYLQAVREVHKDNRKRLNEWFDKLSAITSEEIDRALGKAGV